MKLSQGYNDVVEEQHRSSGGRRGPPNIIQRLSMATGLFSEVTTDIHSHGSARDGDSDDNSGISGYDGYSDDEENQNTNKFSNSNEKSSDQTDEHKRENRRNLARQLSRKSIGSCCDEPPPPVLTDSGKRWEQFQTEEKDVESSWRDAAAVIASVAKESEEKRIYSCPSMSSLDNAEDVGVDDRDRKNDEGNAKDEIREKFPRDEIRCNSDEDKSKIKDTKLKNDEGRKENATSRELIQPNSETLGNDEMDQEHDEQSESEDDDFIGFKPFSPPPAPGRKSLIPRNAILDKQDEISEISMNTTTFTASAKKKKKKQTKNRKKIGDQKSNDDSENDSNSEDSTSSNDILSLSSDKNAQPFSMNRALQVLSKSREIIRIIEGDNEESSASSSAMKSSKDVSKKKQQERIHEQSNQTNPEKPNNSAYNLSSIIQSSSALLERKDGLIDGFGSSNDLPGMKSNTSSESVSDVNESTNINSTNNDESSTKKNAIKLKADDFDDSVTEEVVVLERKGSFQQSEVTRANPHDKDNSDYESYNEDIEPDWSNASPDSFQRSETKRPLNEVQDPIQEYDNDNNQTFDSEAEKEVMLYPNSRAEAKNTLAKAEESIETPDRLSIEEKEVPPSEKVKSLIHQRKSENCDIWVSQNTCTTLSSSMSLETKEFELPLESPADPEKDTTSSLDKNSVIIQHATLNQTTGEAPNLDKEKTNESINLKRSGSIVENDLDQSTSTKLNKRNQDPYISEDILSEKESNDALISEDVKNDSSPTIKEDITLGERVTMGGFMFKPSSHRSVYSSESLGLRISSEASSDESNKGNGFIPRQKVSESSHIGKLAPIQSNLELEGMCIEEDHSTKEKRNSVNSNIEIIVESASECRLGEVVVETVSESSRSGVVVESASESSRSGIVVETASETSGTSEVVVSSSKAPTVIIEEKSKPNAIIAHQEKQKSSQNEVNEIEVDDEEVGVQKETVDEVETFTSDAQRKPDIDLIEKNIDDSHSRAEVESLKPKNDNFDFSGTNLSKKQSRSSSREEDRSEKVFHSGFDEVSLGSKSDTDLSGKTDENISTSTSKRIEMQVELATSSSTIERDFPRSIGDFETGLFSKYRDYQPVCSSIEEEKEVDHVEEQLKKNAKISSGVLNQHSAQRQIGDTGYILLNQEGDNHTNTTALLPERGEKGERNEHFRCSSYFVFFVIVFSVVFTATLSIGLMSTRETSAPLILIPTFPEQAPTVSPTILTPNELSPDLPVNINDVTMKINEWVEVASVTNFVQQGDVSSIAMTNLDGEGFRMAVGSHNYSKSPDSIRTGIVRVYDLMESEDGIDYYWKEISSFEGDRKNDEFGYSISLSEDGSLLVVGIPGYDVVEGSDSDEGRVSIYNLTSIHATIRSHSILESSNTNHTAVSHIDGQMPSEQFGYSCALNKKGFNLAVGAPIHNHTGVVRVYKNIANSQWQQIGDSLHGSDEDDFFGASVSLSENGEQLVVGAPGEKEKGAKGGFAKVYTLVTTNWSEDVFNNPSRQEHDAFGKTVSQSSDGSIILVGSPALRQNRGIVHLYYKVGDSWTESGRISGTSIGDQVGSSFEMSGEAIAISFSKRVQVIKREKNVWSRSEVVSSGDGTNQVVSISGKETKLTSISSKNTIKTFLYQQI